MDFEKLSLNISESMYQYLRQKPQNVPCISKIFIDVLVLNFKAKVAARLKVRKKDFCIVLAGKHQCHDRASLIRIHSN